MWSNSGWTNSGLQHELMKQIDKDRRSRRGCTGAGCAAIVFVLVVVLLATGSGCVAVGSFVGGMVP